MQQTARHLIFRGRVQGVGFRYVVREAAAQFDLTGTVKNLPDGSVEAVLQGPADRIEGCIEGVQAQFRSFIREIHSSEQVFNPHLTDFRIIH